MAIEIDQYGVYVFTDSGTQVVISSNDFTDLGDYSALASYVRYDVVTYTTALYIALAGNTGIAPSGNVSYYWSTLALLEPGESPSVDCCLVGSNALTLAQTAIEIAESGTVTANEAYAIAISGTTLAETAYNLAISGTNVANSVYTLAVNGTNLAQDAYNIAINGTNVANSAYAIAISGTTLTETAYNLALNGTNIANQAYQLAINGTNVANEAYTLAINGTNLANAAYQLAVAGTNGLANKVDRTGDTMTGTLRVPNIFVDVLTVPYAGTITVDLSSTGFQEVALTNNAHFITSNEASGRSATVKLEGDVLDRSLTFAGSIRFLGTAPTSLAAGKVAMLSLTSFGTTQASVIAAYAAEE